MTPTRVHRYAFPVRDAIERLLNDAVGDCEAWRIRIEGDEVVIDVVAPVLPEPAQNMREIMSAPSIEPSVDEVASLDVGGFGNRENRAVEGLKSSNSNSSGYGSETSNQGEKINTQDPEPELKGGALARRAAITCSERGFWTFLGVSSADEAKADVCRRCGITTRKLLDHDERAAAIWDDIIGKYRLWLEGHDVDLD